MKIIFISDGRKPHRRFTVDLWFYILLSVVLLFIGLYSSEKLSSFLSSKYKVGYRQPHTLVKQNQAHSFATIDNTLGLSIEEKIKNLEASIIDIEKSLKVSSKEQKEIPLSLADYNFISPVKHGYISSRFGYRKDPFNGRKRFHSGLDIALPTNSNIYAIANGFVTYAGRKGTYGKLLEINHSKSIKSRYAHLNSFLVKSGQLVKKGDLIGKVGSTGRSTGPHLHLEIKENKKAVDPYIYLKTALKTTLR